MPPHSEVIAHESDSSIDSEVPVKARKEILVNGYYYDVTDWVARHPGGDVIEWYTESGEDATIAIQQFHHRSEKRVQTMMKAFSKRPARESESGLDHATLKRHRAMNEDFSKLHNELVAEGLFKPSMSYTILRCFELLFFLVAGVYLMLFTNSWILYGVGLLSFGLFMGRCGWQNHDGGHHSLTGNPNIDRFIGFVSFGAGVGMSASWWLDHHNKHHGMPQRLEHDSNLETLPLLAFSTKIVKDKTVGKSWFVQNQAVLFLADCYVIILWWKGYHLYYAYQRKNWTEVICMITHFVLVSYFIGIIPYGIAGGFSAVYMILNISLSHTHTPVAEEPTHWLEYGTTHTIDIHGSWWCDWWMGYLNYQIEHHLFPTLPPFNLPKIQDRVRALAEKHNLPFINVSYMDAIKITLKNLDNVAEELAHD